MKLTLIWSVVLSLALAVSARSAPQPLKRQAFGPIKYGMTQMEANAARFKMMADLKKAGAWPLTAAMARKVMIYDGTKYPSKLSAKDATTPIGIGFIQNEQTKLIDTMRIQLDEFQHQPLEAARECWAVLKDIGESKFGKMQEEREYPSLEECMAARPRKTIVTGYWEHFGIRIELSVSAAYGPDGPDGAYVTMSKAASRSIARRSCSTISGATCRISRASCATSNLCRP